MIVSLPDRGPSVLRFLSEYMTDAPDDLGLAAAFVSAPPEESVPNEMHFAPAFGLIVCWTGELDDGERILAPIREVAHASRPGPMAQPLLEPMGGAISRVATSETALGVRDVPWWYHALSMWMEPDEATATAHVEWARALAQDLAPHATAGVYLNFTSDVGDERVLRCTAPSVTRGWSRSRIATTPPTFRLNQNIKPSAAAAEPPLE
jgi:hypothetical protein